jgi:hypothetical protein
MAANGRSLRVMVAVPLAVVVLLVALCCWQGQAGTRPGQEERVAGQEWLARPWPEWAAQAALKADVARYRRNPLRPIPPPANALEAPVAWRVTDAGSAGVNGDYHKAGRTEAGPYYRNAAGWFLWRMEGMGEAWVVSPALGFTKGGYWQGAGKWEADVYALSPAPVVKRLK